MMMVGWDETCCGGEEWLILGIAGQGSLLG